MKTNPVIYYDGFCNLCSGVVSLIKRLDKKKIFNFVPLQSAEAIGILNNYEAINTHTDTVVLYSRNQIYLHADAVIEIGKLLGFPFNFISILRILPLRMRDKIYSLIAAHRYKWFGKRNSCRMPDEN